MARRRMSMAIRPVQRIKHVVDNSATLVAGTDLPILIINTKDAPVIGNTTDVITGSKVNGVYIRVEVASTESDPGAIPNVYMALVKNPGGNLSFPSPNAVGGNDNKRFVIHQEMIMLNNLAGGNARTLFNGVVIIPKGYRRFGPNDRLDLIILSPQVNIAVCVQAHYKEFR